MNVMFVTNDLHVQATWSDIKEHTPKQPYEFDVAKRFTRASNLVTHQCDLLYDI